MYDCKCIVFPHYSFVVIFHIKKPELCSFMFSDTITDSHTMARTDTQTGDQYDPVLNLSNFIHGMTLNSQF